MIDGNFRQAQILNYILIKFEKIYHKIKSEIAN